MQINESINELVRLFSSTRVLIFVILFRTARLPRTVFYEGWAGDNLLVSYELPRAGAAVMLGSLAAQLWPGQASPVSGLPRERERESGQSQYYNLLQSLRAQPAAHSSQQPHS